MTFSDIITLILPSFFISFPFANKSPLGCFVNHPQIICTLLLPSLVFFNLISSKTVHTTTQHPEHCLLSDNFYLLLCCHCFISWSETGSHYTPSLVWNLLERSGWFIMCRIPPASVSASWGLGSQRCTVMPDYCNFLSSVVIVLRLPLQ